MWLVAELKGKKITDATFFHPNFFLITLNNNSTVVSAMIT